ncbi:MAG: hypothetical protein II150_06710 [Thermoguttaceae bacterium]|nr:hypothetical protein [Thermoguttaceae bacterium]
MITERHGACVLEGNYPLPAARFYDVADAAGGFCSGESRAALKRAGIDPADALRNNDAYHALQAIGGLIITGPTGTNVNDLTCALVRN